MRNDLNVRKKLPKSSKTVDLSSPRHLYHLACRPVRTRRARGRGRGTRLRRICETRALRHVFVCGRARAFGVLPAKRQARCAPSRCGCSFRVLTSFADMGCGASIPSEPLHRRPNAVSRAEHSKVRLCCGE